MITDPGAQARAQATWEEVRESRNIIVGNLRERIAHAECRDYIAAIERELHAWGVIPDLQPQLWHW